MGKGFYSLNNDRPIIVCWCKTSAQYLNFIAKQLEPDAPQTDVLSLPLLYQASNFAIQKKVFDFFGVALIQCLEPDQKLYISAGDSPRAIYCKLINLRQKVEVDNLHPIYSLNDRYAVFAAAYAAVTKRRFLLIEDVGKIRSDILENNPLDFCLFAELSSLNEESVRSLRFNSWCDLWKNGREGCGWGIISAPNEGLLTWLLVKLLLYSHLDSCDFKTLIGVSESSVLLEKLPRTVILRHAALESENIELLQERFHRVISMQCHSDLQCASSGHVLLCGQPEELECEGLRIQLVEEMEATAKVKGSIPHCHSRGCFITAERPELIRVSASRICSQVMFMNSCGSFSVDCSRIHPESTISMSCLRGYFTHFIASQTIKIATPIENVIFVTLLQQGWTIGDALWAVNAHNVLEQGGWPPFLLIGDPSVRLMKCVHEPNLFNVIEHQGQALINVYPKNRTDVPVVLKLEYAFLGDRKPTEIINRDYKVGDPLLVVTWFPDPHKNCSYCILMSSATTSRAFSVELNQGTCDTKSIRSWSKKIAQSLDNLKLFPLVEIEQYKMAEQIVCCASALAKNSYLSTSYANRKGMERYLLTQIREQLSELHAALALNTIKWLTGRNSLQLVNKVDYVVTYGHDSVGKCSTCHNVLETIRYESVTATYPDRILLLCSTCGLVGNHPACGSKVTISSDSMVNLPKFQVSVCADKHDINYSALNLPVTFGVCLINSRCFGYSAIETSWIVDRTSKATFVLEDCETRLSTGPYVLVALEIVGFDVSFGLKPIKVLSDRYSG